MGSVPWVRQLRRVRCRPVLPSMARSSREAISISRRPNAILSWRALGPRSPDRGRPRRSSSRPTPTSSAIRSGAPTRLPRVKFIRFRRIRSFRGTDNGPSLLLLGSQRRRTRTWARALFFGYSAFRSRSSFFFGCLDFCTKGATIELGCAVALCSDTLSNSSCSNC
jgi:hypothetical protein